MSYAWAFDDGATSTLADPTHQFATAGSHSAELTVTYADGSTDTDTVTFDVIAEVDDTAPVTTATTTPADPNGTRPVTVTLSATDAGTGVARTEYRINGGAWQEYSAPFRRSEPGEYRVEYRSFDRANNEEEPAKQLTFTISVIQNCTPDLNDEFDGDALSDEWDVLNPDPDALSVAGGQLALEIRAGDLFGDQATAKNVLLKDAPDGPWVVTTRLDVRGLDESGQQAGLVLWSEDDPNTFAKIVYINKGDEGRRFEYVATREDAGRHPGRPDARRRAARGLPPRAGRRRWAVHPRVLGGRRGVAGHLPADRGPWRSGHSALRPEAVLRRGRRHRGEVPVLPRRLLGPHRADVRRRRSARRRPTPTTGGTGRRRGSL